MSIEREDIRYALTHKGFQEGRRARDHDFYWLVVNGKRTAVFTKLSTGTGHRTYRDGLVKKVAAQVKLTVPQFKQYVSCSMSHDEYLRVLRERGINLD